MSKKKSDLNRGNSRKSTHGNCCHPETDADMNIHIPNAKSPRKALPLFSEGPTLQDAINRLSSNRELSQVRRRDLTSSLRRVASALGSPPAQVPADLQWLRSKLVGKSAVRLGPTAKTRANILSNAIAALELCGLAARRPAVARSPAWDQLWSELSTSAKIALGSFARFCSFHRIDPDGVTDQIVANFRTAMVESSLRKKSDDAIRELTNRWNPACVLVPSLCMRPLSVPQRRVVISTTLENLPRSFRTDFENYIEKLRGGDVLDDDAIPAPVPATIKSRRLQVRRFFGELVASGVRPGDVPNLAAIVRPDMAHRGLKAMLKRQDDKPSGMIHNMAYALLIIAKHYARSSDEDLKKLRTLCKKLKPKRGGMTEKNRGRLRQLDDPQALSRLLLLPDELVREAKSKSLRPQRAAALVEIALAIELFLMTSLRVKNVASLNLDENIQWSRSSARGIYHLVIEGRQVKNGVSREVELNPQTVSLLKLYLDRHRPILAPASCRWLFAKRDGSGPVDPVVLARRVSKAIRKRTGFAVNVHLFRAIGAKIYLDQNPGSYEVVRRMLGHKHLATTTAAYIGMENISAAKQFDLTVSKRRDQARGQKAPSNKGLP